MHHTRRRFLQGTLTAGLFAGPLAAIDPIRRTGKPQLIPSLAAYSFNRHLALNAKRKPTMTLEDFIDFAAGLSLPAVELTAYYFPKTTPEYLDAIKKRCDGHGLKVSGTAVGNDFCWPDEKKQAQQLDMVKEWIERTARLGGKTLRIFAGSVKKGDTEADARKRCLEMIGKACEFAGKHKVILAIENHGGITATADQLLRLVEPIQSDWYGVNLDTGNFRTADPYADLTRVAPYAVVVQLKTEIFPGGKRQEADLKRITDILRRANYQGYVALEYEAAEEPRAAVPRYIKELKELCK